MADKIYKVKNRSAGVVIYRIPEDNIRREFMPGETKAVPLTELEKLSYQPGGQMMMNNFLQIQSAEAQKDLNIPVEPEYNYSEQDIIRVMTEGSLDEFLDMLDFAPTGVMDLVRQFAVSLPLNDFEKRRALKNKTGFDVNAALTHVEEEKQEDAENGIAEANAPQRRVKPAAATPGRRVIKKVEPVAETDDAKTEE